MSDWREKFEGSAEQAMEAAAAADHAPMTPPTSANAPRGKPTHRWQLQRATLSRLIAAPRWGRREADIDALLEAYDAAVAEIITLRSRLGGALHEPRVPD
jgi:hypothetical protein